MTDPAALVRSELANQLVATRSFLAGSPALRARYRTGVATVAGLTALTCGAWAHPLFNRVIGAGVLAPLDGAGLDALLAHYDAAGCRPCVEVYVGHTPPAVLAALAAAGFADGGQGLEAHLLETDRAPRVDRAGVTIRRIRPDEHRRFGELVRDGFGVAGDPVLGPFFVDLTEASLAALGADGAAFVASMDGADAGTGQLVCSEDVAGCYSGSVLEPYRGRGIQKALIAARVAEGLARGRRRFSSQTDPDSPSGHNLHDLGFRTLYQARWYVRPGG